MAARSSDFEKALLCLEATWSRLAVMITSACGPLPSAGCSSRRVEASVEIEKLGIHDITLMDEERIEASLNVGDGRREAPPAGTDVVLLTDRRIIHLAAKGGRRKAVFASLQDVGTAEITREGVGYGGYVWGVVAFFVALMLWQVWDHPLGSPLGALAVALMGVYLIIDHRLSPPTMRARFTAGSTTVECGVEGAQAAQDIYGFVNRLFQLKDEDDGKAARQEPPARRDFAPR